MAAGPMLESWKAIAAHLRRNVRTCQLWERAHGLPVHRLDGSPKARVFAYPDELDRWFAEKIRERDQASNGRPAKKGRAGLPTLPRWNIGLIAGLAIVAAAATGASIWLLARQARIRWANDVAIPEIERLLLTSENQRVFDLAVRAEKIIPRSPRMAQLMPQVAAAVSIMTNPPGASVFLEPYSQRGHGRVPVAQTPVTEHRLAQGYWVMRIEKPGFEPIVEVFYIYASQHFPFSKTLERAGGVPQGMVRVGGGEFFPLFLHQTHLDKMKLVDFYLDRYEVTNLEYKKFMDAGGYARREFWKTEIVRDGHPVPWAKAVAGFTDKSGRPGPSTWIMGEFSPGQENYPVSGVSWYEASAYAEYAGKRLPSVYHWGRSAGDYYTDTGFVLPASNFGSSGPTAVGQTGGLGPYGTYDMAGNVKEWCSNATQGRRYCLGGSWQDDEYMFNHLDAYDPGRRDEDMGFRCMRPVPGLGEAPEIDAPIEAYVIPDFTRFKPCSDEVFEAYSRLYAYTKTDLRAQVESREVFSDKTLLEKVTFDDTNGAERITAYLFLPRRGTPPFQTVVYFPGAAALRLDSIFRYSVAQNREVDLFTNSGRAFVFPILKGTFERKLGRQDAESRERRRDLYIQRIRDFARTVDYLGTRGDIDSGRLAYQGLSWGANVGPVILALDKRFRAAVFLSGGMDLDDYRPERYSPETDPLNFAPRATTPILIMNGRYDFLSPIKEESSVLLGLMGAPDKDKRLRVYETGHHVWQLNETRRDAFDWLDKYLGPTGRSGAAPAAGR